LKKLFKIWWFTFRDCKKEQKNKKNKKIKKIDCVRNCAKSAVFRYKNIPLHDGLP